MFHIRPGGCIDWLCSVTKETLARFSYIIVCLSSSGTYRSIIHFVHIPHTFRIPPPLSAVFRGELTYFVAIGNTNLSIPATGFVIQNLICILLFFQWACPCPVSFTCKGKGSWTERSGGGGDLYAFAKDFSGIVGVDQEGQWVGSIGPDQLFEATGVCRCSGVVYLNDHGRTTGRTKP